jgi:hypothetical protein
MVQKQEPSLKYAKPVVFYRVLTGYLKQLSAEVLFVKTSVFIGDVYVKNKQPTEYGDLLAYNLKVITELYPRFMAPYYYAQAFLPDISYNHAVETNSILAKGLIAYPEDLFLSFLHATNYFLHLNDPIKAAESFAKAAKLPNAPPLFSHLSAILSVQGGEIKAGLLSLQAMLAVEQDEDVRKRYEMEIDDLKKVMKIKDALQMYHAKYGGSPDALDKLVPEFLSQIPVVHSGFTVVYERPHLHIKRIKSLK